MDGQDKQQDSSKSNVFDFYSARRREQRSDMKDSADEPGYYACGISLMDGVKEEWFRLHGEIEGQYSSMEMVRYIDLVRIYSPVPELFCIMCEDCIYTLEGRNLDVIALYLQDRSLRALYLFDPDRDAEPRDDEPVILRMEREDIVAGDP